MGKTICIDFDGPINPYTAWKGRGVFEKPKQQTVVAIHQLWSNGWRIIVHTCRSETDLIAKYMDEHNLPFSYINYNPDNTAMGLSTKPVADVYLDDRAITFDGTWDGLVAKIIDFKPYYQRIRGEK